MDFPFLACSNKNPSPCRVWEKLNEAIGAFVAKGQLQLNQARAAFGYSKCKLCIVGAAPSNPEVLEFFKSSVDMQVLELYGMSECTGPHTFNLPNAWKITSVGKPMLGVRVKIDQPDENGEGEVGRLIRACSAKYTT